MRRIMIVYNPNSSQYIHVRDDILNKVIKLKGYVIGKFAIKKAPFETNVKRLTGVLENGDLVLAAGGDATAAVCANAILESNKDVALAVLPCGNFNDLARTLGTMKLTDIFRYIDDTTPDSHSQKSGKDKQRSLDDQCHKLYPLDIIVDGKHWRYATCYVTIGMTGEAVAIFDDPKIRKKMQQGHKSSWRSYLQLSTWYFKNRHKKRFIPDFKLNGKLQHPKTSDYAALSGRSMCRVMKGREDYLNPTTFRSEVLRTVSFPRLFILMARSILYRVPGHETKGDILEFIKPSTVSLQAEGEYCTFKDIERIEVKKPAKYIKVIQKGDYV